MQWAKDTKGVIRSHKAKTIALSGLCFMASDYPFGIFCPLHCLVFVLWLLITPLVSFAHCIVWSSFYGLKG
jgi:hypothetical protein